MTTGALTTTTPLPPSFGGTIPTDLPGLRSAVQTAKQAWLSRTESEKTRVYRPWACRPRRPETKGKVERPFHYVEKSLFNGRTFRTLEHLNEVTRWWLANVNDVRLHRTTKKRPVDAHAEEKPHLLPLPAHNYDTANVIYRVVNSEGHIIFSNNHYSVPWRLVGELLPVRVTETELLVYNRKIQQVARHSLLQGSSGEKQVDPAHSIGRCCCTLGYRVRYVTSAQLLEELMAASGDGTLTARIRYYGRFDLLIVDEFGFDKLERAEYPESPSLLYKVSYGNSRHGIGAFHKSKYPGLRIMTCETRE